MPIESTLDLANVLVPLTRPDIQGSSNAKLFIIHPISGMSNVYQGFFTRGTAARGVYGVNLPPLELLNASIDSCEKLAKLYAAKIREVQPKGPYCLAGWSFGGKMAFKVAHELQNQNEEIAYLALLDGTMISLSQADTYESLQHMYESSIQSILEHYKAMGIKAYLPSQVNISYSNYIASAPAEITTTGFINYLYQNIAFNVPASCQANFQELASLLQKANFLLSLDSKLDSMEYGHDLPPKLSCPILEIVSSATADQLHYGWIQLTDKPAGFSIIPNTTHFDLINPEIYEKIEAGLAEVDKQLTRRYLIQALASYLHATNTDVEHILSSLQQKMGSHPTTEERLSDDEMNEPHEAMVMTTYPSSQSSTSSTSEYVPSDATSSTRSNTPSMDSESAGSTGTSHSLSTSPSRRVRTSSRLGLFYNGNTARKLFSSGDESNSYPTTNLRRSLSFSGNAQSLTPDTLNQISSSLADERARFLCETFSM